jgi:hypothetical protein
MKSAKIRKICVAALFSVLKNTSSKRGEKSFAPKKTTHDSKKYSQTLYSVRLSPQIGQPPCFVDTYIMFYVSLCFLFFTLFLISYS